MQVRTAPARQLLHTIFDSPGNAAANSASPWRAAVRCVALAPVAPRRIMRSSRTSWSGRRRWQQCRILRPRGRATCTPGLTAAGRSAAIHEQAAPYHDVSGYMAAPIRQGVLITSDARGRQRHAGPSQHQAGRYVCERRRLISPIEHAYRRAGARAPVQQMSSDRSASQGARNGALGRASRVAGEGLMVDGVIMHVRPARASLRVLDSIGSRQEENARVNPAPRRLAAI